MARPRDPELAVLVAAALLDDPGITAVGLEVYLRARGRPVGTRRAAALLARDRGPRPPPTSPLGARVWLTGDTIAALRAAALPGEGLADTIGRLAARAR